MPISWSQRRQARRFSGLRGRDEAEGPGEDHRDGEHLLAGLTVAVDLARFGMGQCLAAGGRGAHAEKLLAVHRRTD